MSKVSILIPCYNAEKWIAEAIQSALDQSIEDKEVIVVDDGSTDGSLEVVKSFGDQIQFESGPNRGGNVARNRLLELAAGEWVQFLDADDYLRPKKIEAQIESTAKLDTVDAVYSPVACEKWEGGHVVDNSEIETEPSQSIEEQWIRWRVAQTGSVLWRRESLKRIGGWNEEYPCCQDNEVTLRAIKNGLRFHYYPRADAIYRIWSEETVCRKDPAKVIHFKTMLLDEMLEWLKRNGKLKEAHSQAAGQAFFEMARILAKSNLNTAGKFVGRRRRVGPFFLAGAAAPANYRLVYKLLGFKNAERVASWMRK